ncbi:MAG: TetR/AcrR family transcriptional regulator [Planctomycetaceae bacterium]|nr:TetR/AcrR family transcriptional regulator [Planctomycetaceae bacterium]
MAEAKLDTEVRREQIIDAALTLAAEHGLRRLSVAAVARRVGLVPSGIYRHFKSKDDIIAALLDRVEQRLMANVEAARRENVDPLECLKSVLMRHIRFLREGKVIFIPRTIFSDDVHVGNPERRRHVLRIFTHYMEQLRQIVREGQTQGLLRADMEPQTAAMMFFGIIVPAGIMWHLTDGGFDVTRHALKAWRLFCAAVTVSVDPSSLQ